MTTTTQHDQTAEVIASMLGENTGRHFLDSGGAYGRNWERNQGMDVDAWMATPRTMVDVRFGYLDITISTFHFLRATCEFDPELDALWDEFDASQPDEGNGWLYLMEDFGEWLRDNYSGFEEYEWNGTKPTFMTVNTYNGEDSLSQTLQYTMVNMDGNDACFGDFVLLQIHGGCDVRGGYTRPRVFRVNEEFALYDNARLDAWCEVPAPPQNTTLPTLEDEQRQEYRWTSYNGGYSWDEDSWPHRVGDLKDFEWVECESEDEIKPGQLSIFDGKVYGPVGTELHFGSLADYA